MLIVFATRGDEKLTGHKRGDEVEEDGDAERSKP